MRASRILFVVLIWLVPAQSVAGQTPAARHSFCRDPQRADKCASYLLFELNFSARVAGTEVVEAGCTPPSADFCRQDLLLDFIAADVGVMKNLDLRQSVGLSIEAGGSDDGGRLAVLGRYRRWLSNKYVADASLGPLMAGFSPPGGTGMTQTYGLTGDVSVGRARVLLATAGFDMAHQLGRNAKALRVGLRCESRGLAVGGAIVAGGLALVWAALSSNSY
jgi:hypothetical protein